MSKTYSSGTIFCDIDGTLLSISSLESWDPYNIPGRTQPGSFSELPILYYESLSEEYFTEGKEKTLEKYREINRKTEEARKKHYTSMISVLPNVVTKLIEWHVKGYRIILTTARPESLRQITMETLEFFGIIYNDLIMDLPQGIRIVINDIDPAYPDTHKALAINVVRNKGLEGIDLP